ncbi:MAG TPA: ABC transporter permease [Anaerolineales bacterium]|nr:ABC transporter permease [Anaerolineales bacterium]
MLSTIKIIFGHELIKRLVSRSFLFGLFGVPILLGVLSLLLNRVDSTDESISQNLITNRDLQIGLVLDTPATTSLTLPSHWRVFDNDATAKEALAQREIQALFIVGADYLKTGAVDYYGTYSENFVPSEESETELNQILQSYLLGEHSTILQTTVPVEYKPQHPNAPQTNISESNQSFPLVIAMLMFILIFGGASQSLSGVASEKENRIMEVLLTSVQPTALLAGKVLAIGLLGLLQLVVWAGIAGLFLRLQEQRLPLEILAQLQPSFFAWLVIFFLLGYALYATLMTAAGALVPRVNEAGTVAIIIGSPLLASAMFSSAYMTSPNSLFAIVFSLFPFTAPVVLLSRMTLQPVPLWQLVTALLLLVLSALLALWLSARMFVTQSLLSGASFKFSQYLRILFTGRS